MAPVRCALACQPPCGKIAWLQPEVRARKDVWLMSLHPEELGADVERLRVMPGTHVDSLASPGSRDPLLCFVYSPVIRVEQRPAQGVARRVEWRDGWRLPSEPDGAHAIGTIKCAHGRMERRHRAAPPVFGLLLRPRVVLIVRWIVRCPAPDEHTLAIQRRDTGAAGPHVQRQHD